MLDLHNLKIEKTIRIFANPFSKHRDDLILTERLEGLSVTDEVDEESATNSIVSPTKDSVRTWMHTVH